MPIPELIVSILVVGLSVFVIHSSLKLYMKAMHPTYEFLCLLLQAAGWAGLIGSGVAVYFYTKVIFF